MSSSPPHSICYKMLDGNNYIIGKRVYHLPYGALIPNELDPPCIRCYLKGEAGVRGSVATEPPLRRTNFPSATTDPLQG